MKIFYIGHSGFLVETGICYYLFDYYQGTLPVMDTGKPVIVFASHFHEDHFQPLVFEKLRLMGMSVVQAVLAKDISARRYPEHVDVLKAYAHQKYVLINGTVVETLLSTDSGVAFLVTTEEGVIYHAGDLNDWTWEGEAEAMNRQMQGSYRHEIDKLADREIDVAFVPLDPRQDKDGFRGMDYFLKKTKARCVFPMHYWNQPTFIDQYLELHPEYVLRIHFTESAKPELIETC